MTREQHNRDVDERLARRDAAIAQLIGPRTPGLADAEPIAVTAEAVRRRERLIEQLRAEQLQTPKP